MTQGEIVTAGRRKYNAVGSTFWSDAEIYDLIYEAQLRLCSEARMLVESVDSTNTTTDGTQTLAFPSTFQMIKRIEVNGSPLKKVDFHEDDALTLYDADTTDEGSPEYYFTWNRTIYFRPIPDTTGQTIRIFGYALPTLGTAAGDSVDMPVNFHMDIANYVASELAAKDQQIDVARHYENKWELAVLRAKKWAQKRRNSDGFAIVKDVESLPGTILGAI